MCLFLSPEAEQGNTLPSCFSSHKINKCLFGGLFGGKFYHVFVLFLVGVLLFKMAPKHNAEMLPSVPMCRKAVMYLTKKIGVLNSFVKA